MATKKSGKKVTKSKQSTAKSTDVPVGALIPQPHGGAIRNGGTNAGGTGRPPDEVRRAYRELGATKGFNLVDSVLDGNVRVRFYGMCPGCKKDWPLPEGDALDKLVDEVGEAVRASVDQQLKANEQALKYGLGTKDETTIVSADVTDRLKRQVEVIASRESWTSEELLSTIGPIWTTTKG
jgi:hypothetical protein